MNPNKVCSTCQVDKPLSAYAPDPRYKSGFRPQCALCRRTAQHKSRLKYHLWYTYKITMEEYDKMLLKQNGLCAICEKPETRTTRSSKRIWEFDVEPRLVVDHNHETGVTRGLLCHKCNVGVGQLDDSIERLEKALEYLRSFA